MSDPVAMIMPMAGRGSRFAAEGETLPKPLIELHERPFSIGPRAASLMYYRRLS